MEALKKKLQESGAWDHLSKTLLYVIRDKPGNALEVFETLSQKARAFDAKLPELDQKEKEKAIAAILSMANMYKSPSPPKTEEGEDPEPEAPPEELPVIPDLMFNAHVIGEAGVGLGEEEVYKLSVSIHEFAIAQGNLENKYKTIRFFGKILGTGADYYVIECGKDEWPEPDENAPRIPEPMGKGVNKYQYWVSNLAGPSSTWTALPALTPAQLNIAKQMRKFFTGNLNAEVKGYPYFPWKEAGYLRAQIAQITHGTVVSPKGVWKYDEDAEDPKQSIRVNENYKPAERASSLLSASMWCHHRAYIMPDLNRTSFPETEGDEEEKKGLPVDMLTTLDKDIRSKGQWGFSLCTPFGVRPGSDENAVVCAKSIQWPGALCAVKGKTIVNVYVGYGISKAETLYKPPPAPTPADEFNLPAEKEDPITQPESAEEKQKEEGEKAES